MTFTWNERKHQTNIRKHGLSFSIANELFDAPMITDLDDRFDYGEDRWVGIGRLYSRILVIVFATPDDETIRVISLRKALSHERKRYAEFFGN